MQTDEVLERFLATGEFPPGLPGFTGPPAQRRQAAERAVLALGRLDGVSALLPDKALFLYAYVRKEAVLSSQI